MKSISTLFLVCAGLLMATSAPLRADFVATSTLTAAADNATTSSGSGSATLAWLAATDTFTYTLSWSNLTGPATMAHIHYGAVGVNGPVVEPFFMPTSSAGYLPATDTITGTLTAANFMADPAGGINSIADIATAIQAGDAYVNIHTAAYPAGELRGQLAVTSASATPEPATTGLVLMALAGSMVLFLRRRRAVAVPVR